MHSLTVGKAARCLCLTYGGFDMNLAADERRSAQSLCAIDLAVELLLNDLESVARTRQGPHYWKAKWYGDEGYKYGLSNAQLPSLCLFIFTSRYLLVNRHLFRYYYLGPFLSLSVDSYSTQNG